MDMSTSLLPKVVPEIDANLVSFYLGGGEFEVLPLDPTGGSAVCTQTPLIGLRSARSPCLSTRHFFDLATPLRLSRLPTRFICLQQDYTKFVVMFVDWDSQLNLSQKYKRTAITSSCCFHSLLCRCYSRWDRVAQKRIFHRSNWGSFSQGVCALLPAAQPTVS